MLGQYLSDHRTQIRDREARREDFRIRNFEIQRDSLLKLQEVIVDLTRNIGGIVTRARLSDALGVNDFPGYNDAVQWHAVRDRMQKIAVKVAEGRVLAEEAVSSDELPAKRKQELQAQLRKLAADSEIYLNRLNQPCRNGESWPVFIIASGYYRLEPGIRR